MKIKWVDLERRKKASLGRLEEFVKKKMNTIADKVKKEVDETSAVDTGKLLRNNKKTAITKKKYTLSQKVKNDTPYAIYVEYGRCFQNKSNKYWRTWRQGRMIYQGIGLRYYHRTAKKYKK